MMIRLLAALCLGLVLSSARAELHLVVLDVGEGQSVLLKRGEHGVLIDAGRPGMALHVLDRLTAHGIRRLDYLILTHLHPDHAGGYFRLREAFPETPVFDPVHPLPRKVAPDLVRWLNETLARDPLRNRLSAGMTLDWRDVAIRALWPEDFIDNNLNRHSLVLDVTYEGRRIAVMGDATHVIERALLAKGLVEPVDVLVAGHHGAKDTGTEAFLAAVAPRFAVVSVNADNVRGYPAARTMERLAAVSGTVLRTDKDGEICLRLARDYVQRRVCP